jgi:uncharacterized membrane protein YdbT with pleckstrin-like domain
MNFQDDLNKNYTQNWKGYLGKIILNSIFIVVFSLFALVGMGTNLGLFFVGLVVYNMLRIGWILLVCKNTKYSIEGLFFKDESGVLNKRIDTMDICKIKDLSLQRSIIDRIFGLSTVLIVSRDATAPIFKIFAISKEEGQEIFDYLNSNATDSYVEMRRRG